MEPFVGAIFSFGFNFAPYGWAQCNGQLMPISQYEALYSLIGTTYGGDGHTTFGLPNLEGRVPIGTGQGLGLPNYILGQVGGNETETVTIGNLPAHTHPLLTASISVSDTNNESATPANCYYGAADSNLGTAYSTANNVQMAGPFNTNSGATGSGFPINVMSPFLVINYCISLLGIYPTRN